MNKFVGKERKQLSNLHETETTGKTFSHSYRDFDIMGCLSLTGLI